MRVAAFYDVHGNLPALEAVLDEVRREDVDAIVSGGDVLWGPSQSECLALLREADAVFIHGNCERDVLEQRSESTNWCHERLTADDRAAAASWPATAELDVDGMGRVLFCHATPRSDEENLTSRTSDDEIADALAGVDADLVVAGHTHVQMDRRAAGAPRLVNAGSIGLPCQGEPGAFWAIVGADVELRCTEYDVERAAADLRASGFPPAELLEEMVRGRASAESATAYLRSRRRAA